MGSADIDEEQAKAQIGLCEGELNEAESDSMETRDAEHTLKLAHSLFKTGNFKKAFLFAVRARRMIVENQLKNVTPRSKAKKIKQPEVSKKK